MSRSFSEQSDLENLIEQRDSIARMITDGDYSIERFKDLARVMGRLSQYGVNPATGLTRAAVMENSPKAEVGPEFYDLRTHGIETRVVELKSGRRGLVKAIIETKAEWVEPLIQWDDGELSRARYGLILEDNHGEE